MAHTEATGSRSGTVKAGEILTFDPFTKASAWKIIYYHIYIYSNCIHNCLIFVYSWHWLKFLLSWIIWFSSFFPWNFPLEFDMRLGSWSPKRCWAELRRRDLIMLDNKASLYRLYLTIYLYFHCILKYRCYIHFVFLWSWFIQYLWYCCKYLIMQHYQRGFQSFVPIVLTGCAASCSRGSRSLATTRGTEGRESQNGLGKVVCKYGHWYKYAMACTYYILCGSGRLVI